MQVSSYDAKQAALMRFLRTFVPQIPAILVAFGEILKLYNVGPEVLATLVFLGTVATTLDKVLRDAEIY